MALERVDPAEVEIDAEELAAARAVLEEGVSEGDYPGAVLLVVRHGKIADIATVGRLGGDGSSEVVENSIYDIASVTKPVATASSLMILRDRGEIRMDQRVSEFFPGLPYLKDVTLHDLATHTSGLPAWRDYYSDGRTRAQVIESILHEPLENPTGEKYVYSCLGYITLTAIIEKVTGDCLSDFAKENIFKPLGMSETGFNPSNDLLDRIAPTAHCPMRDGILHGVVHDGNARAMDGVGGNAGLFSTVRDLAVFGQMLLNGGVLDGKMILRPHSVELMLQPQISSEIGGQTYGLFAHPNEMLICAATFSDRVVGHSGFTGTLLLVDPILDSVVVLLTNRVFMDKDGTDFLRRRRPLNKHIAAAML